MVFRIPAGCWKMRKNGIKIFTILVLFLFGLTAPLFINPVVRAQRTESDWTQIQEPNSSYVSSDHFWSMKIEKTNITEGYLNLYSRWRRNITGFDSISAMIGINLNLSGNTTLISNDNYVACRFTLYNRALPTDRFQKITEIYISKGSLFHPFASLTNSTNEVWNSSETAVPITHTTKWSWVQFLININKESQTMEVDIELQQDVGLTSPSLSYYSVTMAQDLSRINNTLVSDKWVLEITHSVDLVFDKGVYETRFVEFNATPDNNEDILFLISSGVIAIFVTVTFFIYLKRKILGE
jgi:hypothetical protein